MRMSDTQPVEMAFEREALRLAIADIQPLKIVGDNVKKSPKYAQIIASIAEVGIIEIRERPASISCSTATRVSRFSKTVVRQMWRV